MLIINHISKLNEALPEIADTDDTSVGLVVVSKPWDMNAMALVGRGDKLCDALVLMYLPKDPLDEKLYGLLQRSNVKTIFQPLEKENFPCKVEDDRSNIEITLLLQAVLAVMPISVFVHEADVALRKCFTSMLETFPNLFTLRWANLTDDLLTVNQRLLRALKPKISKALNKGENLKQVLQENLPTNAHVKNISYHHKATFQPVDYPNLPVFVQVKIEVEKEICTEVFEIKKENWKFWEKS